MPLLLVEGGSVRTFPSTDSIFGELRIQLLWGIPSPRGNPETGAPHPQRGQGSGLNQDYSIGTTVGGSLDPSTILKCAFTFRCSPDAWPWTGHGVPSTTKVWFSNMPSAQTSNRSGVKPIRWISFHTPTGEKGRVGSTVIVTTFVWRLMAIRCTPDRRTRASWTLFVQGVHSMPLAKTVAFSMPRYPSSLSDSWFST